MPDPAAWAIVEYLGTVVWLAALLACALMILVLTPVLRNAAMAALTHRSSHEKPTPQWKAMVDSLHVRGRLTNGDTITYALGLVVAPYRGLPRVEHSGATAGYRADLLRFPGRGLAVAVLCNAASANPVAYANQLVDSLFAGSLGPVAANPQRPRQTLPSQTSPFP